MSQPRLASTLPPRDSSRRIQGSSPSAPAIHLPIRLLFLCYSPFHGESDARDAGLLATARVLLAAGADPNTRDAQYSVPALYAVTGMRSVLPIARLLLDAGANPTDGESIFHAAEQFHEDALELLLQCWRRPELRRRLGEHRAATFSCATGTSSARRRVKQGFEWLLNHGADPNVVSVHRARDGAARRRAPRTKCRCHSASSRSRRRHPRASR